MTDQDDIPENEQTKSSAVIDMDAKMRQAAFKVGDEVTMKVSKRVMIDGEEKTRVSIDAFTIAGRHCHLSHWQYKLEDGKGLPYDSGNWVPEGKLDAI